MPQDLIRLNADLITNYIAGGFFFSIVLLNLKYKKLGIESRKFTAKGPFGKVGTVPLNDYIGCENSRMEKAS